MKVVIERVYLETETLSSLYVLDGALDTVIYQCKGMELPWKENKRSISCIPEGEYTVVKEEFTEKHQYPHFRVLDVKGRSGILWHKITYVKDLKGCLGIGGAFQDLNKDGVPDIVSSGVTLQKLYDLLPDRFLAIYRKKQ